MQYPLKEITEVRTSTLTLTGTLRNTTGPLLQGFSSIFFLMGHRGLREKDSSEVNVLKSQMTTIAYVFLDFISLCWWTWCNNAPLQYRQHLFNSRAYILTNWKQTCTFQTCLYKVCYHVPFILKVRWSSCYLFFSWQYILHVSSLLWKKFLILHIG